MTEMVERVARAMWERNRFLHKDIAPDLGSWEDEPGVHDNWLDCARAAIAAMREPTEAMKNCSEEIHWGYSCHVCGGLTQGWYAMIGAALENPPRVTLLEIDGETGRVGPVSVDSLRAFEQSMTDRVIGPMKERAPRQQTLADEARKRTVK